MITRVEEILTLAKKTERKYRMVVACAESTAAIETAHLAQERGLVESILVGQRSKMEPIAQELCVDLAGSTCATWPTPPRRCGSRCN